MSVSKKRKHSTSDLISFPKVRKLENSISDNFSLEIKSFYHNQSKVSTKNAERPGSECVDVTVHQKTLTPHKQVTGTLLVPSTQKAPVIASETDNIIKKLSVRLKRLTQDDLDAIVGQKAASDTESFDQEDEENRLDCDVNNKSVLTRKFFKSSPSRRKALLKPKFVVFHGAKTKTKTTRSAKNIAETIPHRNVKKRQKVPLDIVIIGRNIQKNTDNSVPVTNQWNENDSLLKYLKDNVNGINAAVLGEVKATLNQNSIETEPQPDDHVEDEDENDLQEESHDTARDEQNTHNCEIRSEAGEIDEQVPLESEPIDVSVSRSTTESPIVCADSPIVCADSPIVCADSPIVCADGKKAFPIFSAKTTPLTRKVPAFKKSPDSSPCSSTGKKSPKQSNVCNKLKKSSKDGKEQLILDFGQKLNVVSQCGTCGMMYTHGDPVEEASHSRYHNQLNSAIKFPGWKNERVLENVDGGSRIIVIYPRDSKNNTKKVEDIKELVDQELGFSEMATDTKKRNIYLYISNEKKVCGVCIAEPISEGYCMIASDSQDHDCMTSPSQRAWCCSNDPESATCGISRIWVSMAHRKNGIATKLIDCIRSTFIFGRKMSKNEIAFSDPTPNGRAFASKYTGTDEFLVYKYIV